MKSIPVDTSARSVQRIARHAAQNLAQIDVAVRLDRGHRERRQRAVGRVADHPQRREGQPGLGRIGRRDMAFHVDGGGAGLRPQRRLAGARGDHLLDAGQTAPDDASGAASADACDQIFVQRQTGQPAMSPAMTSVATTTSPDFSDGSSPPATPKLITPRIVDRIEHREQRAQLLRIATAADDGHAGPSRDAGLLHQTGHNQDRPRVNRYPRIALVPHPQIHIPTPTTLLLVFFRFRYRANAQSGKNFAYP